MEKKLSQTDNPNVSAGELLLLSIPVSILFAVSGMDFIGFFTSTAEVYTRSLPNVLSGFLFTTLSLLVIPVIVNLKRWKKPLGYFGTRVGEKKIGIIIILLASIFIPVLYFSSNNINIINTYPLTKGALSSLGFFIPNLSAMVSYLIPSTLSLIFGIIILMFLRTLDVKK